MVSSDHMNDLLKDMWSCSSDSKNILNNGDPEMANAKEQYNPSPVVIPGGNNESKDEAKHPGAVLGLVMGAYPLMLIVAIVIALAYVALTSSSNNSPVPSKSNESSNGK